MKLILALFLTACGPPVVCITEQRMVLYGPTTISCEIFQRAETQSFQAFRDIDVLKGFYTRNINVYQHSTPTWMFRGQMIGGTPNCPYSAIEVGLPITIPHELAHMARGCQDVEHADWATERIWEALEVAQVGLD